MITLPSAYLSAIPQGEPTERIQWVAIFSLDAGSNLKTGGTQLQHEIGTSTDAFAVDFIIKEITPITSTINPFDGSYSVTNCTIVIADIDIVGESLNANATLAEVLDLNSAGWKNRPVSIYKCVTSQDINTTSEKVKFFSGMVSDYSYDAIRKQYTFDLVHISEKYHKELPSTIVTRADYPNAPDESLNKPIPILYGHWYMNTASPYFDEYHNLFSLAPCICINEHEGYFAIANHAINAWDTGNVCIYDEQLSAYGLSIIRNDFATYPGVSLAGPAYAVIASSGTNSYWIAQRTLLFPTIKGTQSGITTETIENITDKKYDTTLALTVDYFVRFNGGLSSKLFWAPWSSPNATSNNDVMPFTVCTAYAGGPTTSRLRLYNPNTGTFYQNGTFNSSTGLIETRDFSNASNRDDTAGNAYSSSDDPWTIEELGRYEFGIDVGAGVTCTISTFGIELKNLVISEVPLRTRIVKVPVLKPEKGKRSGRGRTWNNVQFAYTEGPFPASKADFAFSTVYGRNVEGRAISSTIGDRAGNTLTTGNTLGLSNFIAEDIFEQELAIGGSNVDTTSFDAADESKAYRFCFSLPYRIDSKDLLADMGISSMSVYFVSADGYARCYQIPDDPSVPSYDVALDFQDVRFVKFYWSSPELLVNSCLVNYHYDYATAEYKMQESASDTTSQGGGATGYNRTRQLVIDSPYLRHQPFFSGQLTASDLATNMVGNWKDEHICIDFELTNLLYEGLQEGDTIVFNNVPGDGNSDSVVSCNPFNFGTGGADDCMSSFVAPRTKYFLITSCTRGSVNSSYSCMQLHDFS